MDEKILRLLKWMNGEKAPPVTLELNITNKCNLRCLSCWQRSNSSKDYSNELPKERWIEIVEEAGKFGVREIRIPGSGEPMVRKDVVLEIIDKAFQNGMSCLLITNGTLFDEKTILRMVGKIDNVTFSIDGPNEKINDYLRGKKGSFRKATLAIKKFNYWKRKLKEKKPLLRINTVISNKNFDKLDKMVKLAYELGCDAISFQPMTVFSKFGEKLRLSNQQLELFSKIIPKVIKLANELKIFTNLNEFMKDEAKNSNEMDILIKEEIKKINNEFLSSPCFEPWYNMIIMPNGSVGPCAVFGGNSNVNVKEKTLKEIWFGKYFNDIRKRLLKKKLFPWCKNCCVVVFEENKRLRRELLRVIDG
jgi:MoaA/NifB/PqqE/SkfB family radical SAM enzyme